MPFIYRISSCERFDRCSSHSAYLDDADLEPDEQGAPGRSTVTKRPSIEATIGPIRSRTFGSSTRKTAAFGRLYRRKVDRWRMDALEASLTGSIVYPDTIQHIPDLPLNRRDVFARGRSDTVGLRTGT